MPASCDAESVLLHCQGPGLSQVKVKGCKLGLLPGGQAVEAARGAYLEAPVSGSKGPAEAGQLIFLAGGDQGLFERAQPVLDVMGKAAFFLGPARGPCTCSPGPFLGLYAWKCLYQRPWVHQRAVPHPSSGQMPGPCAVALGG